MSLKKDFAMMAATAMCAAQGIEVSAFSKRKIEKTGREKKKCKSCANFDPVPYHSYCSCPLNIACKNYKPRKKK